MARVKTIDGKGAERSARACVRNHFRRLWLVGAALFVAPSLASAACGGIATAYCISAFSSAATPPGVGAIPGAAFSFQGPGAFSVTLSDPISGNTGVNVVVTDGGEALATTGGLVTGTSGDGLSLLSDAGPTQATIGSGGVNAPGAGVRAISGGAGNVVVEGAGPISAGGPGVFASTAGGNVYINETGAISGATGISANTSGAGGMTVFTTGAVTGTAGNGVLASSQDGLNTLVVGAGGVPVRSMARSSAPPARATCRSA